MLLYSAALIGVLTFTVLLSSHEAEAQNTRLRIRVPQQVNIIHHHHRTVQYAPNFSYGAMTRTSPPSRPRPCSRPPPKRKGKWKPRRRPWKKSRGKRRRRRPRYGRKSYGMSNYANRYKNWRPATNVNHPNHKLRYQPYEPSPNDFYGTQFDDEPRDIGQYFRDSRENAVPDNVPYYDDYSVDAENRPPPSDDYIDYHRDAFRRFRDGEVPALYTRRDRDRETHASLDNNFYSGEILPHEDHLAQRDIFARPQNYNYQHHLELTTRRTVDDDMYLRAFRAFSYNQRSARTSTTTTTTTTTTSTTTTTPTPTLPRYITIPRNRFIFLSHVPREPDHDIGFGEGLEEI